MENILRQAKEVFNDVDSVMDRVYRRGEYADPSDLNADADEEYAKQVWMEWYSDCEVHDLGYVFALETAFEENRIAGAVCDVMKAMNLSWEEACKAIDQFEIS